MISAFCRHLPLKQIPIVGQSRVEEGARRDDVVDTQPDYIMLLIPIKLDVD